MMKTFQWSTTVLVVAAMSAAGCAGPNGGRQPVVQQQIPAPKEAPAPPPVRAEPIDVNLQTAARNELNTALASTDPLIHMHAVEAAQNALGAQATPVYLAGLKDPSPGVRFASAMSVGMLQIAVAKPVIDQLVNDENPLVQIAVRYALHRLGDKSRSKDLEGFAKALEWQQRAETARVLGLIGEPTAVRILIPMLHDREAAVRLQAADSLWRLGNQEGLRALVSATISGYPDDQMVALLGLAWPKDNRVLGHLRSALTADYQEVCLVAARAMGICGSDAGYTVAVDGAKSRDPRQRLLAAMALGAIGRSDAQRVLADLLKDKDSADVRLSAAQALLQLKAPTTTARQ